MLVRQVSKTKETVHVLFKKKGIIEIFIPWLTSIDTHRACQAVLKSELYLKHKQEKRNAVEDYTYKVSFQLVYIILKLSKN